MSVPKKLVKNDLPVAKGPNVFMRSDYEKESGVGPRQARERLARLASDGLVRRVRTSRNGKLVPAWEYIG